MPPHPVLEHRETSLPELRPTQVDPEACGPTVIWGAWAQRRAGQLADADWHELEEAVAPTAGHCGVMGTASTMACIAEALGMTLPGKAAIPAVHAQRSAHAEQVGS